MVCGLGISYLYSASRTLQALPSALIKNFNRPYSTGTSSVETRRGRPLRNPLAARMATMNQMKFLKQNKAFGANVAQVLQHTHDVA